MKGLSIALVVVGVILMVVTGVKYFTREKVVDVGKLEITKEKPHWVTWSPFVGAGLLVIGGILYFTGNKKTA